MTTSYELKIDDHPAKARHPVTGEILVKDGKEIPLFKDQKCIKLDGRIIGYVLPNNSVSFIMPKSKLGEIANEAIAMAREQCGEVCYGFVSDTVDQPDEDSDEDLTGDEDSGEEL